MTFDDWAENNEMPRFLKKYEQMRVSWDAAIDEAVKAVDKAFAANDCENLVSLEEYMADKIKELK